MPAAASIDNWSKHSTMTLFRAVYSSRPFGFDSAILNGILVDARRSNERDGITGALICRGDIYLPVARGPQRKRSGTPLAAHPTGRPPRGSDPSRRQTGGAACLLVIGPCSMIPPRHGSWSQEGGHGRRRGAIDARGGHRVLHAASTGAGRGRRKVIKTRGSAARLLRSWLSRFRLKRKAPGRSPAARPRNARLEGRPWNPGCEMILNPRGRRGACCAERAGVQSQAAR